MSNEHSALPEKTGGGRVIFGLQDFLVLLGAITLVVLQLDNFADDPGVGWHLRAGEFIAVYRQIPDYDPFLFSETPRRWISDQWFSDLVFYVLKDAGGWPLLYGTLICLYLLTYFGILYTGVVRLTGSALASAVATFLAFKIGQLHFILRAAMIGFTFFSATYVALYAVYKSMIENQPLPKRVLFLLPLLFCIWANVHPSFVLGLVLVSLLPLALLFDNLFFAQRVPHGDVLQSSAIAGLCFLATLINPYGIELHRSILSLSGSTYFMNLHSEWLSPNFKEFEGELFLIVAGLIALGAFLGGTVKLRWRFFDFLLVGVFAYLGLRAVRVLPYFGIAATIPLVEAIRNYGRSAAFSPEGQFRRFPWLIKKLEDREWTSGRGGVILGVVMVAVMSYAAFRGEIPLYRGALGPSVEKFPYQALDVLNAQRETVHPIVFAGPEWGGFITLLGGSRIQPVIDDRNTLLGEEYFKNFYDKAKPGEAFLPFVESTRATHLLVSKDSPIVAWIRQGNLMDEVFRDKIAILYKVRRSRS